MNEKIKYRTANLSDVESIAILEKKVWDKNAASSENVRNRVEVFPHGNVVAVQNNKIVGYVSTIIINENKSKNFNTWYQYTDDGNAKGVFDPKGELLFGISLTVDDEIRNEGIGSSLLLAIARMAIENNLKAGILGGRLPFYYTRPELSVEEYANLKDEKGRIFDPELRLYKRMGLTVVKLQPDYFKDPESLDYGVILRWNNPFYSITKVFPFFAKPFSYLFRI
jgi:ribosomal protein S18 acetylase RimI-like enzyme